MSNPIKSKNWKPGPSGSRFRDLRPSRDHKSPGGIHNGVHGLARTVRSSPHALAPGRAARAARLSRKANR